MSKPLKYQEYELEKINSFSTEETLVGKWVDGKNLYRRFITATLPKVSSSGFEIYHDDNTDFGQVLWGHVKMYEGTQIKSLPEICTWDTTALVKAYYAKNLHAVYGYNSFQDAEGAEIFICFIYTKINEEG